MHVQYSVRTLLIWLELVQDRHMGKEWVEQQRDAERALIERVAATTKSAVITGPAGARWLGVANLDWVERVDLAMQGNGKAWGSARSYTDRVYRSSHLGAGDHRVVNGVRVTSLIRCMFDTYRYHGRLEALVQIESARNTWPALTVEKLLERTKTLPRAKGLRGFRELIAYSASTSESVLETIMRDQLLRAIDDGRLTGVRTLEFQVEFIVKDSRGQPLTVRVDAVINGVLLLEADGASKYDGTFGDPAESMRRERQREKALLKLQKFLTRFNWDEISSGAFLGDVQESLDALAARSEKSA